MKTSKHLLLVALAIGSILPALADSKPKLTLDEFFDSVSYSTVAISPDGTSVVICTDRADWGQTMFRSDLWLYRDDAQGGSLIQLTQSGHDSEPEWSPDGRWIAFLSERKAPSEKGADSGDDKEEVSQIYLISPAGGEAIRLTQGEEEVHTFSWSADSHTIYFATRSPWSKAQQDGYKRLWNDVVEYRTSERGDTVYVLDVAAALTRHDGEAAKGLSDTEKESELSPGAHAIATSPLRVQNLVTSPDGCKLAFVSRAINQRLEKVGDLEIFAVDLAIVTTGSMERAPSCASAGSQNKPPIAQPRQLTHNQALEGTLRWASDNRHVFFIVWLGDVTGTYRDLQPHLYWVDSETGAVEQWGKDFIGPVEQYTVAADGVLASARVGTEVAMYSAAQPSQSLHKLNGWDGTYQILSTGSRSPRVAFVHSSVQKPVEVYLAENPDKLNQSRPITSFNKLLTERDLPQGKPYRWKADDGTTVEGMLIYPPGRFEAKGLPMFTRIHGGPAMAVGNDFLDDWDMWAALAATDGWLVFEPNYRGSTGYGDTFAMQVVPVIVSRPGKDILEGVDALVKDGTADPDHLTIGGYSYGGYLTNWLITQTTRFKAAVTGAGAVEHIANWGNDDDSMDDAYFLGGRPWEAPQRYHDEAAIFQIEKVRTPTHMVAGAEDVRVAVLEDYLLEHALYSLGIPNKLLIFPGEGHELDKNPWHRKITAREELKWLQKYGGVPAGN